MSHNVGDYGGQSLDRQSEATVELNNQLLIGLGERDNYSNSGATTLTNTTLYFYDSSPINNISGATLTGSSGWYSSVTLPAGRYIITVGYAVEFSASGQFAFQIYNGSSLIGSRGQIGDSLQFSTEAAPSTASASVSISSSTTFSVRSPTGNTNIDTIANQGGTIAERAYLSVLKVL